MKCFSTVYQNFEPPFFSSCDLLLCILKKVSPFFLKIRQYFILYYKNTLPAPFGKYLLGFLWEQPKMANLWYFCCHISKLISFFSKTRLFFKRSYHYSSSSLRKKLTVFVVYFGPSPSMQLFCENKIKIIFVSWTEYFNVEVLEVTFIQHF